MELGHLDPPLKKETGITPKCPPPNVSISAVFHATKWPCVTGRARSGSNATGVHWPSPLPSVSYGFFTRRRVTLAAGVFYSSGKNQMPTGSNTLQAPCPKANQVSGPNHSEQLTGLTWNLCPHDSGQRARRTPSCDSPSPSQIRLAGRCRRGGSGPGQLRAVFEGNLEVAFESR